MTMIRLNSDRKKRSFLQNVVDRADKEAAKSREILSTELLEEVRALSTSFSNNVNRLQNLFGQRRAATAELTLAVLYLQTTVRHFQSGLNRRIVREQTNTWGKAPYKLHVSKDVADLTNRQDWVDFAEELLVGEAQVVAAGGAPMANPSAADLIAAKDAMIAATDQTKDLDMQLGQSRIVLDVQREQVLSMHNKLSYYFRFALNGISAAKVRQVMRAYGFTFEQSGGLDQSEGDGAGDGGDGSGSDTGSETGDGGGTETGDGSGTDSGDGSGTDSGGSDTGTETGDGSGSDSGDGVGVGAGSGTETQP